MASSWYSFAADELLRGNIDFVNDDITVLLVSDYTPDFDLHRSQDDIPEASQVIELSLLGKTVANRIFVADDVEITSVESGIDVQAVVIMRNGESMDTTTLIGYMDGDGFPFTTDGSPITIEWDRVTGIIGV